MEEEEAPGSVKVICRFRPLNDKEKQMNEGVSINFLEDNKTVIVKSDPTLRFTYDYVFTPFSLQQQVYDASASPIVDAVMQGFNGTVFAYGQTSSGKTFTMTGPDLFDPNMMGIIPRMIGDVFSKIQNSSSNLEFTLKVGYCEIYMEKIKDLLNVNKVNLKVHEDRTRGVYIEGLTEKYASSSEEVYHLMKVGTENREVAYTNMNAGSSRSHSIFIVTITQTNSSDYSAKVGKLYLVDLAGSEKVGKTGAVGKRLEEAKTINKSLTMLGQVINALTDGKSTHVPYRDSKLTRVLQDSLGGNSKTALIITCSPSPYNEAETISTLRFGIRAKAIKNKPKINREYTVAELKLMLAKAKDELAKKDKMIKALQNALGSGQIPIQIDEDAEEEEELNENEVSKLSEYDEVIQELEDLRSKYSEECEKAKKYKQQLTEKTIDYENLKYEYEEMSGNFKEINENYKQIQKDLKMVIEDNEKLILYRDMLKNNCSDLETKVLELEKQIISKNVEIEQVESHLKNQKISELTRELQNEHSKNGELLLLIEQMQKEIEIQRNSSPEGKSTKSETDSKKVSHKKCNEEKNSLIKHLQNRCEKVIQLEVALDEIRDRYQTLENSMNFDIDAKSKIETLEKNLEFVSTLLKQTQNENNDFRITNKIHQNDIERFSEKYLDLELKLAVQNEKIDEYENIIKDLCKQLHDKFSTQKSVPSSGNFVKPIKGGLS
ncbi:unnamed protein product [Blepharisma stoltei]|uniref:Kinesin-like protein n=1 Tax=Blepharisma stoltei TaxID=1481888 RepID=A0AAU9JFG5_9CILI|nr:unnamed protein product [Blepharisma stoltei]